MLPLDDFEGLEGPPGPFMAELKFKNRVRGFGPPVPWASWFAFTVFDNSLGIVYQVYWN